MESFIAKFDRYVLPTYTRYPVTFVKAKGMRIWDDNGDEYLDFFPGWGVGNLGHCHPIVVDAVKKQCEQIMHVPNIYYSVPQGLLAEKISKNSFNGQVFFCNSGAEANEGAIKLARKRNPDKKEIITLLDSFHGRTLAAITATGQPKYQKGFEPLVQGFTYCNINDCKELETKFSDKTAAIMMEPVQGEGGVNLVSKEFMNLARELCDKFDALLILDEVQTGLGRTGRMFGYQHFDIEPDVMTLAKALGGGMPIGAIVVKEKHNNILVPGTHASTFGGNAVACSAGCAVFEAMEKEDILSNVKEMEIYLRDKLESIKDKYEIVKDVRGMGLMFGMELTIPGSSIVDKCRERKLLINCTHENVLRLMPALNVTVAEINTAVDIIDRILSEESR